MNKIVIIVFTFGIAIFFYSCSDSNPISTNSTLNSEQSNGDLVASGEWTFAIKYTPAPDPYHSLPVPLTDARVFIEKVGIGIVSDTLISDINGLVIFNVNGLYNNGDYIVHSEHYNKNDFIDMGGHININYNISPAGIYRTVYCFFVDPIEG